MRELGIILATSLFLVSASRLSQAETFSDAEVLMSFYVLNSVCKLGMQENTEVEIVTAIEELSVSYKWTTDEKNKRLLDLFHTYQPQKKRICARKGPDIKVYNMAVDYIEKNGVTGFLQRPKKD